MSAANRDDRASASEPGVDGASAGAQPPATDTERSESGRPSERQRAGRRWGLGAQPPATDTERSPRGAQMSAPDDLAAAVAGLGLDPGAVDAAALAPLLERVAAGVGAADALAQAGVAPPGGGLHHLPVPDTSAWAWRAILPATGDGPLAGVRLAVKDLVAVGGRPLWAGSAARLDAPPEQADAHVVAVLRRAGAAVVGAVKLHEFAFGVTGHNTVFGTPHNPAAPGRVPGGSSSGSGAAVAAGEADLAIGTDTGGSVRIPAALCGVVGFKPSYGAISTRGVLPLAPSLDHLGFLGPNVRSVLAAATAAGVSVDGLVAQRLRLGVVRSLLDECDPEVAQAFNAALERLGPTVELVDVDRPAPEAAFAATTAIMYAEAAWVHRRFVGPRWADYGHDVRTRLVQGLSLSAEVVLARPVDAAATPQRLPGHVGGCRCGALADRAGAPAPAGGRHRPCRWARSWSATPGWRT